MTIDKKTDSKRTDAENNSDKTSTAEKAKQEPVKKSADHTAEPVAKTESATATKPKRVPSDSPRNKSQWIQHLITSFAVIASLVAGFQAGRLFSNGSSTAEEGQAGATSQPTSQPTGQATSQPTAQPIVDHSDHDDEEEQAVEYVCPMHPQIRRNQMDTCPICHMDLVPVDTGAGGELTSMEMSEAAIALAQLRIETVQRVPITREIRVFGRVQASQEGDSDITAWTSGRIERMYVEADGERVRRGQRLVRVYSPELVIAQETLLHGLRNLEDAQAVNSGSRIRAAEAAIDSARDELRLLGMSSRQIEDVVEEREADEYVDVRAPVAGTVMARHVSRGDHVNRGDPILSLVNLDEVWVQLEIYERDLPYVEVGMTVELDIAGYTGGAVEGEISFIDPILDPVRRVARARVALPNEEGNLRPDMFVEGLIQADREGAAPVSVPASAVMWTGRRSLVYVFDAIVTPPVFMPVQVVLGDRIGDRYLIEDGLWPGEQVVVNGSFRIDASLEIRGLPSMMHPESLAPHAPMVYGSRIGHMLANNWRAAVTLQGILGQLSSQSAASAEEDPDE